MLLTSKLDIGDVERLVMSVSQTFYRDNLTVDLRDDSMTRQGLHKTRFTLATRSSFDHGARTAANDRHMPKASWDAHRDVMRAIFKTDPDAVLKTALITYRGADDFNARFESTGDRNIGSQMAPRSLRSTSI